MINFIALLLVATLFGGMLLYSFGFAPLVFSALPGEEAGRLIRAAFPWYYLFVIVTAGVAGAILILLNAHSAALALGVAAAAVFARQVLMPMINDARASQSRGEAAAKQRFGRLHGISVALNLIQLVVAGDLLYRFL